MAVMTAQPPLPLVPDDACPVGTAAAIVEDDDGGRVFVHGHLAYAWDGGDCAARRSRSVRAPTDTDLFGTPTEFVEAGPVGRRAVAPLPAALRRSYDGPAPSGASDGGINHVRRRTRRPAVTPPSPRRMKPYEASGTRRVPATGPAQSDRLRANPPLLRCALCAADSL